MSFRSLRELQSFVRSLDVPDDRRDVVEAELLDHFFARIGDGATEAEALAAFGAQDALRVRFEPVERTFRFTRRDAIRDGARLGIAFLVAMAVSGVAASAAEWVAYGGIEIFARLGANVRTLWDDWYWVFPAASYGARIAIGFAAILFARPRRGIAAPGRVRSQPYAAVLFMQLASGLALFGALDVEAGTANLFKVVLGRWGWLVQYPSGVGGMISIALWALLTFVALVYVPLPRLWTSRDPEPT